MRNSKKINDLCIENVNLRNRVTLIEDEIDRLRRNNYHEGQRIDINNPNHRMFLCTSLLMNRLGLTLKESLVDDPGIRIEIPKIKTYTLEEIGGKNGSSLSRK